VQSGSAPNLICAIKVLALKELNIVSAVVGLLVLRGSDDMQ
jgi:hypothetical protein